MKENFSTCYMNDVAIPFFFSKGVKIRRKDGKKIVLRPKFDETSPGILIVEDEETGVKTHGLSEEDLISAIYEDLAGNWELAHEPDEALAWGALDLKKKILALFEEVRE